MSSHEAATVPVTSTRWRSGTRHHTLGPGSAGSGPRCPDHARSMPGNIRPRRPETARPTVCLKAVRTFTHGLAVTA